MKGYVGIIILAALVVLSLLTYMVTYTVKSTEVTLVTTFGKVNPDTVYDGTDAAQAGLKFKWPFIQKLVRYDARVFELDAPHSEVTTSDSLNILLTMYCQWRVRDPVTFYSEAETVKDAEDKIRETLRSAEANVLSQHTMEELVSTDPDRMKLGQIEQEVADRLREVVEETFGVEIVAVGVRALGLPESTTEKVIEAMKEERQKEIKSYQSQGTALANAIKSRASSASNTILTFAALRAADIRTEGERLAARQYEQYTNPDFAMFLRSMESLKQELSGRAVFMLDGSEIPAIKIFSTGLDGEDSD